MIHVQGPGGSPANDINISANPSGNGNNNLLLGRLSAQGYSSTYNNFTDASGNVTMWLLPDSAYTFSADTPTGSQFVSTNLSNVNVNSDVNVTIVLQFVHSAPITVLAMATQPDQAGTYDGPVNVTLTATAASDFNIASTFYILDGGVQETYNGTFTIAENGTHTVQYWSVDNLGVGELPQTTSFTINNNKTITSTALTSSPTPSIQGQTVTFTATINPVPDSGTILFQDNGINLEAAIPVDSDGQATYTTSALVFGVHTITAVYSGDDTFGASSSFVQQKVNGGIPVITSFSPTSGGIDTVVNIYGFDFTSVTGVSIGGTAVSSFTFNTDDVITAVLGNGSSGVVTVTASGGTSSSSNTFDYLLNSTPGVVATVPLGTSSEPIFPAVNTTTNRVYVATQGIISVIDGSTNSLMTTVKAGMIPEYIAVNPNTNMIYEADGATNSIFVMNGSNNSIVSNVSVGTMPVHVVVNPNTNRIYVVNNSNSVSVIDGATNEVIDTISVGSRPTRAAVNTATNLIYIINQGDNTVSVIDGFTDKVVRTVAVGNNPYREVVDAATNKIYVTNQNSNYLSVIDGVTNNVTSVNIGSGQMQLDINSITDQIYAVTPDNMAISVLDGATNTLVASISIGGNIIGPRVNSSTNLIYVPNSLGNCVSIINGYTNSVEAIVPLGNTPSAALVDPISNHIYVCNESDRSVSIFMDNSSTATSTSVTSSLNPSTAGQTVVFTAEVSPIPDAGTIQFLDNGANMGDPVNIDMSGQATYSASNLETGSHFIKAIYCGDPEFTSSAGTLIQIVAQTIENTSIESGNASASQGDEMQVNVTNSTATDGTAVAIALTTLGTSPSQPETGTIQLGNLAFYDVNVNSSSNLGNEATAHISFNNSAVTPQSKMEYWNGTTWQNAINVVVVGTTISGDIPVSALGGTQIAIGTQQTTQILLAPSVNPSGIGKTVTFTASVTPVPDNGTIQFQDNGSNLGDPIDINNAGIAILSTSTLALGTHVVTAIYSGDSNYTGSDSNVINESVPPPWDVDGNHVIDINDVVSIGIHWNTRLGDPNFSANCDVNGDGVINILDVVIVGLHWNQTW